jgi:hypothetical protein
LHGGENQLYYLQKGFQGYGDGRPLTAENAAIRIGNPNAPKKGWFARFTFTENGKIYDKFFGDEEYGGQEASFEALRKFIEEIKGNAA